MCSYLHWNRPKNIYLSWKILWMLECGFQHSPKPVSDHTYDVLSENILKTNLIFVQQNLNNVSVPAAIHLSRLTCLANGKLLGALYLTKIVSNGEWTLETKHVGVVRIIIFTHFTMSSKIPSYMDTCQMIKCNVL